MQMNSFKNLTVRNGWVIDKNSKDLALGKSWMVGWFFFFHGRSLIIFLFGEEKKTREKKSLVVKIMGACQCVRVLVEAEERGHSLWQQEDRESMENQSCEREETGP